MSQVRVIVVLRAFLLVRVEMQMRGHKHMDNCNQSGFSLSRCHHTLRTCTRKGSGRGATVTVKHAEELAVTTTKTGGARETHNTKMGRSNRSGGEAPSVCVHESRAMHTGNATTHETETASHTRTHTHTSKNLPLAHLKRVS